jgi:hypothetical protein
MTRKNVYLPIIIEFLDFHALSKAFKAIVTSTNPTFTSPDPSKWQNYFPVCRQEM